MPEAKPYGISKQLVWDAYQRVKANRGAAGVDGESLEAFEKDLKGNLFKIWNRMSSGSYFPPPVRQMTSRMRGRSLAQVCQDLRMYLPGCATRRVAGNASRWWHNSGMRLISIALPIPLFDRLGLPRLAA